MKTVEENNALHEALTKLTLGPPGGSRGSGSCRFSGSTPPTPTG